jgi:LacI family transcriptional regulator
MKQSMTIKDIAKLCGVSIATVSRVINDKSEGVSEKTILRIRKVIEDMDYHPNSVARSMVTKRSHTIGLVIPDVRNPFFSELARGVEDVCNGNSYGCFLCNTDGSMEKEKEYIRLLRGRVADGVLFTTQNDQEFNEVFLDFQRRKFPFCFIERYVDELPGVPGVYFDNRKGAEDLTDFIISKGHERIAFISGPLATHNARQRKEGFIAAMRRRGLEVDESLIVEGNYKFNGGYEAAARLLSAGEPRFTALLASNDLMALGAYQCLEERGFPVPGRISIAGFDNISYPPVLRPLITTIEIPAYELGKCAAEMLFTLMKGEKLEIPRRVFEPALRDKGSVADAHGIPR